MSRRKTKEERIAVAKINVSVALEDGDHLRISECRKERRQAQLRRTAALRKLDRAVDAFHRAETSREF